MDDIWAAYWLQCKGATVLYGRASVYQKRNVHDLTVDMRAEFLGYERNLELIRDLKDNGPSAIWGFLPPGSEDLYKRYQDHF